MSAGQSGFGITMTDADKVSARLAEMRADLKFKAINSGLVYAARPVRDTMRGLAPSKTGGLRKSIGTRMANTRQKRRLGIDTTANAVIVGPRTVHGRIANILEGGAKSHVISPKKGRFLLFAGHFAKKVNHPGIAGRHFIDSASASAASMMESRFLEGVARYLERKDRRDASRDLDPE